MKKAFCKMCVTICGRFHPDEGAVACYGNRIRVKYTAKWGVQIAGMIFQTGSSKGETVGLEEIPHALRSWFVIQRSSTRRTEITRRYACLSSRPLYNPVYPDRLHRFRHGSPLPDSSTSKLPVTRPTGPPTT